MGKMDQPKGDGMSRVLHSEDFLEMLERGDCWESIAGSYGMKVDSVKRRFWRLPKDVREKIKRHWELMGWEFYG
jgi:hypothetical protein